MKLKNLVLALLAASIIIPSAIFAQDAEPQKNATINPYAIVRLWAGVNQYSEEQTATAEADMDMSMDKTSIVFLGFNAEHNGVKGQLELGMGTPSANDPVGSDNNTLYLRLAYLTYNFGDVELLAGQYHTPYSTVSGQQAVGDFLNLGIGASFDGRLPQVKATYKGAYVAFIKPSTTTPFTPAAGTATEKEGNVDSLFPKTAIGYNMKGESGTTKYNVGIGAAGNMVKIDVPTDAVWDGENIISYLGYVNGGVDTGSIIAKFNLTYGQNTGNFGIGHNGVLVPNIDKGLNLADKAVVDGDKIANTSVIEGFVELGYKMDKITISGAVGYLSANNDTFTAADTAIAYSAQLSYAVEKNFIITPAILYRDHMKNKDEVVQGTDLYAGIAFVGTFK